MMNLPTVLPPPSVISSPSPSSDWIDRVSGVLLFFQRKLRNGDLLRVSDLPRCFSLAVLLRRDPNAVSYDYTCLWGQFFRPIDKNVFLPMKKLNNIIIYRII